MPDLSKNEPVNKGIFVYVMNVYFNFLYKKYLNNLTSK